MTFDENTFNPCDICSEHKCDVCILHMLVEEDLKHGKWKTNPEDIKWNNYIKRKYCSNCGQSPYFNDTERKFILSKYCPNCGVKMEVE